jgi:hypothetical protein
MTEYIIWRQPETLGLAFETAVSRMKAEPGVEITNKMGMGNGGVMIVQAGSNFLTTLETKLPGWSQMPQAGKPL